MPIIQDRSKNYGDRDKGNRVKNWITKKQNFNKTYKIGKKERPLHLESHLSDQGFSSSPSIQISSFVVQTGLELIVN